MGLFLLAHHMNLVMPALIIMSKVPWRYSTCSCHAILHVSFPWQLHALEYNQIIKYLTIIPNGDETVN